jgi:hypothetical protein
MKGPVEPSCGGAITAMHRDHGRETVEVQRVPEMVGGLARRIDLGEGVVPRARKEMHSGD